MCSDTPWARESCQKVWRKPDRGHRLNWWKCIFLCPRCLAAGRGDVAVSLTICSHFCSHYKLTLRSADCEAGAQQSDTVSLLQRHLLGASWWSPQQLKTTIWSGGRSLVSGTRQSKVRHPCFPLPTHKHVYTKYKPNTVTVCLIYSSRPSSFLPSGKIPPYWGKYFSWWLPHKGNRLNQHQLRHTRTYAPAHI